MYHESRRRSVIKAIVWRIIAVLNSFLTLVIFSESGNFTKAILMNVSGFFVFYLFERLCNKIHWGKTNKLAS
jgi:hypothetical protein